MPPQTISVKSDTGVDAHSDSDPDIDFDIDFDITTEADSGKNIYFDADVD